MPNGRSLQAPGLAGNGSFDHVPWPGWGVGPTKWWLVRSKEANSKVVEVGLMTKWQCTFEKNFGFKQQSL
jgi:hypothetical protein